MSYLKLPVGWVAPDRIAIPTEVAVKLEAEQELADAAENAKTENQEQCEAQGSVVSEQEKDKYISKWKNPLETHFGPLLKIFDLHVVEASYATSVLGIRDSDERSSRKKHFDHIRERGEHRKLAVLPNDWVKKLNGLEKMFPNFEEVVDYLRSMFTLAEQEDGSVTVDPILLNGPAGVGKSYFAENFCQLFGVGFTSLKMENAQSNAELAGSSEFWGNTKPGRIFEALVEKDYGNPLFFLDEIDKVSGSLQYDPMSSLYSLLEPQTAKSFCDLSYPWLQIDASRITWICTSNYPENIPTPILDRLMRFDIPQPNERQARRVVLVIFTKLKEQRKSLKRLRISYGAITLLTEQSPRKARQLLLGAIGKAVQAGRCRVYPDDVALNAVRKKPNGIGFF